MSNNDDEFILNIANAIEMQKNETIRNNLRNYAKQNSWEKKANIIMNKIKEI